MVLLNQMKKNCNLKMQSHHRWLLTNIVVHCFGFPLGLVQDGFYRVMTSCCEQIVLRMRRRCVFGQWNDGERRGRNQTPHTIFHILFKKI